MTLRVAFMGTAPFAVPMLEAVVAAGHDVRAAYTRPPRPAGRGHKVTPSAVQRAAERLGVPVRTPRSLRGPEASDDFAALAPDVAVVAAYGLILPKAVLDVPRLGCLNVHASLLPRWRGAAPIQRAILAGDPVSGVCLMRMEEGLDTGPVYRRAELEVPDDATAGWLHDRLAALGARMLPAMLGDLAAGRGSPTPQDEAGVTYAAKIDKSEARIDWREPAAAVARRVRAFAPLPGAFAELDGERLRVLRASVIDRPATSDALPGTVLDDRLTVACGAGALRLETVQRAGRKPAPAAEFLRGRPTAPGARLA